MSELIGHTRRLSSHAVWLGPPRGIGYAFAYAAAKRMAARNGSTFCYWFAARNPVASSSDERDVAAVIINPSDLLEIELGQFLADHVFAGREDRSPVARDLAELIVELIEAKIEEQKQTGAFP